MPSVTFVAHRGRRILRIDLTGATPAEIVAAAAEVQRVVALEPPRSVLTLTLLRTKLTVEAAQALKQCALADRPYVVAGAVVTTPFWKVMVADVQMRGREDLTAFDDEAAALDWLASR